MRSAGKLNSPLALLTTVVVMVEPSFLALTRTPSISPSSAEDTLPFSPAACAVVPIVARPTSRLAKLTVAKSPLDIISQLPPRIIRIGSADMNLPTPPACQKDRWGPDAAHPHCRP